MKGKEKGRKRERGKEKGEIPYRHLFFSTSSPG